MPARRWRRCFAFILATVMTLSSYGVTAHATEGQADSLENSETNSFEQGSTYIYEAPDVPYDDSTAWVYDAQVDMEEYEEPEEVSMPETDPMQEEITVLDEFGQGYTYWEDIETSGGLRTTQETPTLRATKMEGSFYNQLNTRQRTIYDLIENMKVDRILREGKNENGHYKMFFPVSGVNNKVLTGKLVSSSKFDYDKASEVFVTSFYTDLCAALSAFRADCADSMWTAKVVYGFTVPKSTGTSLTVGDSFFGFSLLYGDQTPAMWNQAMKSADTIAAKVNRSADKYTQVKYIHDLLMDMNVYSATLYDNPEHASHQAYSALVKDSSLRFDPVCDGYSKAFKMICDRVGIPTVIAVSSTHAWNNVKMDDGLWYNLDLTWADTGGEYNYFLVGRDTVIKGEPFSKQEDHIEVNQYNLKPQHNNVQLTYPIKTKKAYTYIGKNYTPPQFIDVKRDAWYFADTEAAFEYGIFKGDENKRMAPERAITRGEYAQILASYYKADLSQIGNTSSFSDVSSTAWYKKSVEWAYKQNLMTGHLNKFRPNEPVTRQEMCVIFYNMRDKNENLGSSDKFKDDSKIASWAKDSVYFCKSKNLIYGDEFGNVAPVRMTQRAEVASVFVRYIKNVA